MLHMAHFEILKYHNVKYRKSNKELKFLWAIKSFQTKGRNSSLKPLIFYKFWDFDQTCKKSGVFPMVIQSEFRMRQ